MKTTKINAFKKALGVTYSFTSGNINVSFDKDRVTISSNTSTDAFHDTDIIKLVDALGLNCYLRYNKDENKVELNIF